MTGIETAMFLTAVVGTTATVYSTVEQGRSNERDMQRRERQERLDATSRELQRKKRLNAYMATQNAIAGATGTAVSGSFANNVKVAMRESDLGMATDRASSASRIEAYRASGKYGKRASLVGAVAEGAGGASRALGVYG